MLLHKTLCGFDVYTTPEVPVISYFLYIRDLSYKMPVIEVHEFLKNN